MEGYQQVQGGENGGKSTGNKLNWKVQNREGEVKNSIGNVEAKELICRTHGHKLREWGMLVGGTVQLGGESRGENGTSVIA